MGNITVFFLLFKDMFPPPKASYLRNNIEFYSASASHTKPSHTEVYLTNAAFIVSQMGRIIHEYSRKDDKFYFLHFSFLDAPSHLYMRSCPSVGPSVRPSVRASVGPVLFSKVKITHTRRILCLVSGLVLFGIERERRASSKVSEVELDGSGVFGERNGKLEAKWGRGRAEEGEALAPNPLWSKMEKNTDKIAILSITSPRARE